jgi:hypothetical protein
VSRIDWYALSHPTITAFLYHIMWWQHCYFLIKTKGKYSHACVLSMKMLATSLIKFIYLSMPLDTFKCHFNFQLNFRFAILKLHHHAIDFSHTLF